MRKICKFRICARANCTHARSRKAGARRPRLVHRPVIPAEAYEQPEVAPQVSHFMQVPLRTMVKLPHSPQASPS